MRVDESRVGGGDRGGRGMHTLQIHSVFPMLYRW